MALAESTEAEQFSAGGIIPSGKLQSRPKAIAIEQPFPEMPQEEMLQPSGD
jgi:hypothetical protein